MTTVELIKSRRFIAILRHIPKEYVFRAAKALYDGGVRIFEITFDPSDPDAKEDAAYMIEKTRETLGDGVGVGAGTVLDVESAEIAFASGAEFIVAPDTNKNVIDFSKRNGLVSIPGAFTPTEIVTAYRLGADFVKIFPILPDGEAYLKNVISPLSHIPYIVTGGITPDTVEKFMRLQPAAVAAGASIITKEMCEKGEFDKISFLAREHTKVTDSFGPYKRS